MSDDAELPLARRSGKSEAAFRTISEVAEELDVPQHVLRFWEGKFPQVKPLKRGGGRRYYRPEDVNLLRRIRDLLYSEGYTIKGVQKLLREGGAKEARAGEPELKLNLGRDEDEAAEDADADAEPDPEAMDDGEEGGDEPADAEAVEALEIAPRVVLAPETRRELETLLDELEQLHALLHPRQR